MINLSGVYPSVQRDRRANGRESAIDCSSSYLLFAAIRSRSDTCGKSRQGTNSDGVWRFAKVWVHSQRDDIGDPTLPMSLPFSGSLLHSSAVKTFIRKMEITLVAIFEERWKTVQEAWFGRGKVLLNRVSNCVSVLQCQAASEPKRPRRNIS
jgi:hypothetical protein